ncbi:MAG: type II toxin-antitoxin system RelE/ParE family toxin [Dehalococcoidia bacterium]
MPYRVDLHREARKELDQLPSQAYRLLAAAIDRLAEEPRPRGSLKLVGHQDLWRIRVGRYRIIYHTDDVHQQLTVLRVALRTEHTYRDL